ncbi:MAG: ABC-2 family transporter protein [Fuerstiella sp.]|nr:ABC-2 family transporter protein [Fuerstiella sp.]
MYHARVLFTFLRNGVIRETMFQANFLIQVLTRGFWFFAQIALFRIIYASVPEINGWSEDQYFVFMATGMLVNGIVETFFMPNCAIFSEQIRTGRLDFALLKPIDSQFLVSLERINLAMVSQILLAQALLLMSLWNIGEAVSLFQVVIYIAYVIAGVAFFYSLMITMACSSILLGRNQGLYDFWFYITAFARYPRSIYEGHDDSRTEGGEVLQFAFSYLMPILLVITVPARVILDTLNEPHWAFVAAAAAAGGLLISRVVFHWSLKFYRSASS